MVSPLAAVSQPGDIRAFRIDCAPDEQGVPAPGFLSGSVTAQVTSYQGPEAPGDTLLFRRESSVSGEFSITRRPIVAGTAPTTEIAQVTGSLSERKLAAHGMPMRLTGADVGGHALEIEGDEYYAGELGTSDFVTVRWDGEELSRHCRIGEITPP